MSGDCYIECHLITKRKGTASKAVKKASRVSNRFLKSTSGFVAYNERREAGVSREDSLSEAYVDVMFTTAGIGVGIGAEAVTVAILVASFSTPIGWAALIGCAAGIAGGVFFSKAVDSGFGKSNKSFKRRTYEFMMR